MNPTYKILFVCTGNICRSPTAEGIMQSLIKGAGLEEKIYVDSAGTHAWHQGEKPDHRAIHCAKSFGIDLTYINSRPITPEDFQTFDEILVMDDKNIQALQNKFGILTSPLAGEVTELSGLPLSEVMRGTTYQEKTPRIAKVRKLLDYAPSWGHNVPDPYYNDGFDHVFQMLEDACQNLLEETKNNIV